MENKMSEEKTLVIIKPDAVQRHLIGDIIARFEKKGLKLVGLKMIELEDVLLDKHYAQHKDRPFFESLKNFMKSAPVVLIALSGNRAVEVVRKLAGQTHGAEADIGTIRGDLSMSTQANVVHSSESREAADTELGIFFEAGELLSYTASDFEFVYGEEER
jgi:nucleoside-diphosphate kinase